MTGGGRIDYPDGTADKNPPASHTYETFGAHVITSGQTDANGTCLADKGELEWIPMMAMRKDRTQRYSTATELSEDVGNYMANRPLRAGPESPAYRARKFLRR